MKWPWVSRLAFDLAVARADAAELAARQAVVDSRVGVTEARLAIREAIEMTKLAQRAMLGSISDHETPSSGSVAENDRMAATRRRQVE